MTAASAEPAKPPKWRRRPEHRPQQIIEAALETFGECGLAKARLDDIAKRAGLSKGTIYLYFPNKEELFREVVRHTIVAQIEWAETELAGRSTLTATETLVQFVRGYWAFIRSPSFAALFRLVHAELSNFPDLARFYALECVNRTIRFVTGILEPGMESGEFRRIDPL